MTTQNKTCNKCGETKPLDDFPKRKDSPDGRRAECQQCYSKRQAKWRNENREKYNTYQREYKKSHRK